MQVQFQILISITAASVKICNTPVCIFLLIYCTSVATLTHIFNEQQRIKMIKVTTQCIKHLLFLFKLCLINDGIPVNKNTTLLMLLFVFDCCMKRFTHTKRLTTCQLYQQQTFWSIDDSLTVKWKQIELLCLGVIIFHVWKTSANIC